MTRHRQECRPAYFPRFAATLGAVALSVSGATATPPAPPPARYPVVKPASFDSAKDARAVWQAREGSANVEQIRGGPNNVVKMPVAFKGNRLARAYWDRAVSLDLSADQGMQFMFFSPESAAVTGFTFYLKSGDGWYAGEFEHPDPNVWTHVRIRKSDTRIEGRPRGWRHIETLRIAAWRGDDADTAFYLADLGPLAVQTPVAIVRNESVAQTAAGELNAIFSYTQTVADHLRTLDIEHATLSDLDLSPALLRDKKLVILPYAPSLAEPALTHLADFVRAGGKLLSFYTLPDPLQPLLGIRLGRHIQQNYPGHFASIRPSPTGAVIQNLPPVVRQLSWNIVQARPIDTRASVAATWHNDKAQCTGEPAILVSPAGMHVTHVLISDNPQDKRDLLLAMIGHVLPDTWAQVARTRLRRAGNLGVWTSARETRRAIAAAATPGSEVYRDLARAMEHLDTAQTHLGHGRYTASLNASAQARQAFIHALSGIQKPREPEHRGVWRHSAFPLDGMDWDETVRILADNGFTAFFPNMLWAGLAYCNSAVLPVSPLVARQGDPLAGALAATKKHGIDLHVWKVNWNMGERAPEAFVQRMERENRLQVSFGGQTNQQWLCPSHPANRELEIESLLDVIRQYDIDGIHLDYMRYPSRDHCFCAGCRSRFETRIGRAIAQWPADIRNQPDLAAAWSEFRRETLNTVVEQIARQARSIQPGIKISAAVFTHWPTDRNTIGQDWATWCRKGWVDFVCPMNYTANTARFEQLAQRQRQWAAPAAVWPGIGLAVWPNAGDPVRLFEQIEATRRQNTDGFMIFQYREHEARETLPLCGRGITRKQM